MKFAVILCLLFSVFLNAQAYSSRFPIALRISGGKETKKKNPLSLIASIKSALKTFRKWLFPKWNTIKTAKPSKNKSGATVENSGNQRIQKELRNFMDNPPHNCEVSVGSNIRVWIITITGADDTIYAGEKYKLKFVFPKDYPSKPPGVYFLKPTPKHQHVYSNGDICLNLLGKDWRPMMTAELIAVSILSMLSSAKEKKSPQDNAAHADAPPGQRQEGWMYHDDKC